MGNAKVERRHREAAALAAFGATWPQAPHAVDFVERAVDSGGWSVALSTLAGLHANAEAAARADGRRVLEQRIAEIVSASKRLGLSRGSCESLCDQLADETDDEWLDAEREARERELAAARADERARFAPLLKKELDQMTDYVLSLLQRPQPAQPAEGVVDVVPNWAVAYDARTKECDDLRAQLTEAREALAQSQHQVEQWQKVNQLNRDSLEAAESRVKELEADGAPMVEHCKKLDGLAFRSFK
jgi:hypothetical protein